MPNYNKIVLIGHVAREMELKTFGENKIGKFCIATNRNFQKNGEWQSVPMFIDVDCFGRTAERGTEFVTKGAAILVEGELTMETWLDKDSGKKRTKHLVRAERVMSLSKKGDDDGNSAPRRREIDSEDTVAAVESAAYNAPF